MSRRTRNLRSRSVITLDSDDSCVDLTEDDNDIVDLTSSQNNSSNGANDSSIVVIGSTSDSSPHRRRRNRFADLDWDSDLNNDDDLPQAPFHIPTPVRSSRPTDSSILQSPEPIKITCPVCLDDDKAIKRSKKKLASTTCGHVFCSECINDCVRTQRCCPVCRKRLNHNQVHTLHI